MASNAPKQTCPARQSQESLFKSIPQYSPDLICTVNLKGEFVYVSPSYNKILGFNAKDLLGQNAFSLVHPDDRKALMKLFEKKLPTKEQASQSLVYRVKHKNGSWKTLETSANWIFDDIGNPVQGLAISRDITERQMLNEQFYLLNAALNASANSIIITDFRGLTVWINPAFTQMTGYSLKEVAGKKANFLKSGRHPKEFYEHLWKTILSGGVWQGEMINKKKDGTIYTENQTITPVKNNEGKISHFIGIKLDITDRKRLEEQLSVSQKLEAVGQLAGGIAHDFNNILTIILGTAALLRSDLPAGDPRLNDINEIIHSAERASNLTRQLLAFGRKQILQPKVINLNEVLTGIKKMLDRLIRENINLKTKLKPGLMAVKVDPTQIEQVILNLTINARDAIPKNGSITIETGQEDVEDTYNYEQVPMRTGKYVVLSISDTGTGMDAKTKNRIFEPFFTTKEQGKGTGMGLATVYGIVKQSNGYIWVESELGKGTTFKVYLPVSRETVQAVAEETNMISANANLGHETVLVAEDENEVKRLVRRALKLKGYKVIEASNGTKALSLFKQYQKEIKLVVTDTIMPQMNGWELVQEIAKLNPDTKVLYMSGYANTVIAEHGVMPSEINFIQKPFNPESLTAKVREVLDR